jgi:nitrogen regulatory protein P-II 1
MKYAKRSLPRRSPVSPSPAYRGQVVVPNLIPKVEIKIGVNEEFVDVTVDTILKAARHGPDGQVGDGKIFIAPLEECIRISSGERGGDAI